MKSWVVLLGLIVSCSVSAQTTLPPATKTPPTKKAVVAPKAPEPIVITKEVIKEVPVIKTVEVPTPIGLQTALAGLLNALVVYGVLWAGSRLAFIRDRWPVLVPLAAPFVGLGVAWVQSYVQTVWGFTIDLSPILGLFSGGAAMALAAFVVQRRRQAQARAMGKSVLAMDPNGGPV
jgi:hypothetical protein